MVEGGKKEVSSLAVRVAPLMASMGTREKLATGFFYKNGTHLFVITNRHVMLEDNADWKAEKITLRIHVDYQNLTKNSELELPLYKDSQQLWRGLHPQVDLAAIEVDEQKLNSLESAVFAAFTAKDLPPDDLVIGIGEDLLILGYPLGFYDDILNLPIVRSASIASVYPTPFRGRPYFLVDARVFEGNSGSPVILKPTNYLERKRGSSMLLGKVTFLMGVLSHTWPIYEGREHLGLNAVWFSSLVERLTT